MTFKASDRVKVFLRPSVRMRASIIRVNDYHSGIVEYDSILGLDSYFIGIMPRLGEWVPMDDIDLVSRPAKRNEPK